MITIQPVRYTSNPAEWHRFAELLGFCPAFAPTPDWSEFDAFGVLAVHRSGLDRSGETDLHVRVDDLDAVEARLLTAGIAVERSSPSDVGPMLTIVATTAGTVSVSGGVRSARSESLAVLPVWYTDDLAWSRAVLEAIGLRPRISSDSGGWLDFSADGGGLAALHRETTARVELSLEYAGNLDVFAQGLIDAGLQAMLIDESYSRTVRVTTPDGDELWINGAQEDFYGFTRHDDESVIEPTRQTPDVAGPAVDTRRPEARSSEPGGPQ